MALTSTSYSDWLKQNQGMVDEAFARVGSPAPAVQVNPTNTPTAPTAPAVNVNITAPASAPAPAAAPPVAPADPPPAKDRGAAKRGAQPSNVFQALAGLATGGASQAATAEPTAEPTAPSTPEASLVPTERKGSLTRQLADIQDEKVDTANTVAASQVRSGEISANEAQKKADALKSYEDDHMRRIREADEVLKGNRDYAKYVKETAKQDYEAYRRPITDDRDDLQKATSIITGIVAAMANAGWGNPNGRGPSVVGSGLAMGMQMINEHVNRTFVEQQRKIDAAGRGLDGASKTMKMLADDSASEVELMHRMQASHLGYTEQQLKRIAEEAKVPEAREAALRLAEGTASQGLAAQEAAIKERLRVQAAMARQAAKGPDYTRWSTPQLEALASGQVKDAQGNPMVFDGPAEAELKKRKLTDAQLLDAQNKATKEGKSGVGSEIFPGYISTQELSSESDTKARGIYSQGESIKADLQRLAEIRRRNAGGTWNANDRNEAKAIMESLPSRYSQMFGSGDPSDAQRNSFASYLVDPTDRQYTGLDVEESYRRLEEQVDRTRDAQLKAYGLERASANRLSGAERPVNAPPPAQPARGSAPAPEPGTVPLVHAVTGKVVNARADQADSLVRSGMYLRPAPKKTTPNPVEDMTNEQYEAYIREQQGY